MPRRIDRTLDKVASCKVCMSTRNARRWVSLKNHLGFLADDKLMDYLLDLADSVIVRDENANGNVESKQEDDLQSRLVSDSRILQSNSQKHSPKESNADDFSRSGKLDQKDESKAHSKPCVAKLAKASRRHKRKSKCHKDKHKRNKRQKIKDSCVSTCANQSDPRRPCSDVTDENFTNFSSMLELPPSYAKNDFQCDLETSAATRRKNGRESLHNALESSSGCNQSATREDKVDEAPSCGRLTVETCDENSKQESEQAYSADETPVVSENDDENRTSIVESAIAVDTSKQSEGNTPEAAIDVCKNREFEHFHGAASLDFIEPEHEIQDSITLANWLIKHKTNSRLAQVSDSIDPMSKGYLTTPEAEQQIDQRKRNVQREEEQEQAHPDWPLFARESLPMCLQLKQSNVDHGLGVFARNPVPMSTRFGPLVGTLVQEKDIPDDYSMKHIWEISSDNKTQYVSTTNPLTSNWIRYLRPADTEDTKTVDVVKKNGQLFLVTCKTLIAGTELLYWFDSQSKSWTRKNRMDKTNCGGCNLKFSHPIYYRLHCCIFHDTNYSLTIRKYHCKVCGAAVLGKDNIMKHAAQFHAGRGAYQCQYCKKFFLRLNYLEMHRTYGCSKNPSRSRPLCDFCGRKFCQPQKLKVHIKRMHSETSDVLEEFQCKSCSKLLGSRAALQRHMKEVHHKDVVGAAACDRCGKTFQNKSNLKIHMLTHSGVKPFKCKENECKAAFTTKQCLQFHYKKVHGLSDEMMPKIERSIAYTFDAYSGGLVEDLGRGKTLKFTADEEEESTNNLELEDDSSGQSHEAALMESSPSLEEKTDGRAIKSTIVESAEESSGMKLDSLQVEYPISETFNIDDIPNDKQSSDNKSPSQISPNDEKLELTCCKRQESYNASLLVEAALDAAERDIGVVSIPPLENNEQGNADFYSVPNELCFKSVDYQVAHETAIAGNVDSCFVPNPRQPLSVSSQYRSTGYVGASNRLHSIEQYLEQEIPTSRYDDIVQFHPNHNSQMHSESQPRSTIDSASSDESDSAVQNLSLTIKDKIETSRYNYDADYDSVNKARVKFEPLIVQTTVAEQGLDMSARGIQQTCESQIQNPNHLHHYHHHHHHHHHHPSYKVDENERQGVDLSISSPCVSSPSYASIYPPYSHVDVPRVVNLESSSHQLHTAVSRIIASPLPEASTLIPPDCAPQVRILPSTASPIPSYNSTTWSLGTPHHTPRSGYHYCNYY